MLDNDLQECGECLKKITWDEYVVNWGSCSDCFDEHLNKYFAEYPEPPDSEISLDFEA
jgi:uncharacterized CHY-type Zn-finger protein